MKLLNKEYLFKFLPKINLLLTLSVITLVIYLGISLMRPYQPYAFDSLRVKDESELVSKELSQDFNKLPDFREGVFNRRALFYTSLEAKPKEEEAEFQLLGVVAVGDKISAMLRDIRARKDYYCVEGDEIGAYKVKQIFRHRVILESKGTILEISR